MKKYKINLTLQELKWIQQSLRRSHAQAQEDLESFPEDHTGNLKSLAENQCYTFNRTLHVINKNLQSITEQQHIERKSLKVKNEIINYEYEQDKENCYLKLTMLEYRFLQKISKDTCFPQTFICQENGIEYKLFDVYDNEENKVIAQYTSIKEED